MDENKLQQEITDAEFELLDKLRKGKFDEGIAMHDNSPAYKNIWDGEVKSFKLLLERINTGRINGLKGFDYRVSSRDFKFINSYNVIETMIAVPHSLMNSGEVIPDPVTVISILWQKNQNGWKVGYLHASTEK